MLIVILEEITYNRVAKPGSVNHRLMSTNQTQRQSFAKRDENKIYSAIVWQRHVSQPEGNYYIMCCVFALEESSYRAPGFRLARYYAKKNEKAVRTSEAERCTKT